MNNLAEEKPQLVKEMYARWLQWAKKINAFPLDTREYGARMQAYRRQVNGNFDDNLGGWNVRVGAFHVSVAITGKLSGKKSVRNIHEQSVIRGRSGDTDPVLVLAWPFSAIKDASMSIKFFAMSEDIRTPLGSASVGQICIN